MLVSSLVSLTVLAATVGVLVANRAQTKDEIRSTATRFFKTARDEDFAGACDQISFDDQAPADCAATMRSIFKGCRPSEEPRIDAVDLRGQVFGFGDGAFVDTVNFNPIFVREVDGEWMIYESAMELGGDGLRDWCARTDERTGGQAARAA